MKQLSKIFVASCLMVFIFASEASAVPVSFGDTRNYWPGWNNNQEGKYGYPPDDQVDSLGIPDLLGGTAEINQSGLLTHLTFNQWSDDSSHWHVISPGDLFINVNAHVDDTWDYVVDLTSWIVSSKDVTDPGSDPAFYGIYSVNQALGDRNDTEGYILSGKDHPSPEWSGYIIRDDHPVAAAGIVYGDIEDDRYYGRVEFGGWDSDHQRTQYTFDFMDLAGGGLQLGGQFTIAWQVSCGNDVIYETMNNPVPEPSTLILLGSGFFGLAGFWRRLFR